MCRELANPAPCLIKGFYLKFWPPAGLRLHEQRRFGVFWPPSLASQALSATILAALRRFRPSGLTLRSSRPAYGGRLTLAVRQTQ